MIQAINLNSVQDRNKIVKFPVDMFSNFFHMNNSWPTLGMSIDLFINGFRYFFIRQ